MKVLPRFKYIAIATAFGILLFYLIILLSLFSFLDSKKAIDILLSSDTLYSIRLSLFTATIATFFAVLIGFVSAYALSRYNFRGKGLIDLILEIPMIISPVALGAILLIFFNTPVGEIIQDKGIYFVFEIPGIILAQFATIAGLATRLMKASLDEISPRYEAVARSLGSSHWEAFRKITLPLSIRGILGSIILCWAKAIGEFGATVTLAGTMAFKTETLPIAIFMSIASANIEKGVILILILLVIGLIALCLIRFVIGRDTNR